MAEFADCESVETEPAMLPVTALGAGAVGAATGLGTIGGATGTAGYIIFSLYLKNITVYCNINSSKYHFYWLIRH